MYAFAMAVYLAGFKQIDLVNHLVAQPPFDPDFELKPGRPFYILHYTYGLDFNASTGEEASNTHTHTHTHTHTCKGFGKKGGRSFSLCMHTCTHTHTHMHTHARTHRRGAV